MKQRSGGGWAASWCALCLGSCLACSGAPLPPPAPQPAVPAAPAPIELPPAEPELRADLAALPLGDAALDAAAWQARHTALREAPGRGAAELVVLGDAIAEEWCASRAFQKQWRKRRPLNLALAGDQTQQLLWRIEHDALAGLAPRLVILAVGSENLAHGFSPAQTARGIAAVLRSIRERLPQSPVLVLGLLPSGQQPSDPRRAQIEATNAQLLELGEPGRVLVTDVSGVFLDADGSIGPHVMADFVRPTPLGYEALTLAVSLVAQRLLEGGMR